MTIASEIQRIQTNIANAYDALEAKGATMPATENTDNLVTTISTISGGGGGDVITATNITGSAITEGDKVWVNENSGSYTLERYSSGNNFQNLSLVGRTNIDTKTGIASGFSTSNYLQLQTAFNPGNNPWEIVIKCMLTYEDTSLYDYGLVGYNGTGLFKLRVVPNTKKIELDLSTDDASWNIGELVGQTTLQLNVYYWIKAEFTGSAYNIYLSTDSINYNLEGSLSSTTAVVFPSMTAIGYAYNHGWCGSIDLSETYTKVNGEITNLIQTTNQYELTRCNKNNYFYADSFIDEKCVFFPSIVSPQYSHYLLNKKFSMGSNPWSLHTKIKSPMDSYMNSTNVLFSGDDNFYTAGFSIELSNNTHYLGFGVSTDNSSWNIGFQYGSTVIQPNTWYWIIVEFTGTKYLLKLSTDGVNYTDEITFTSSSYINPYSFLVFGHRDNDRYWRGNIDFSETYIDINGNRWISCAMIVNNINQNTLIGYAQENIANGSTGEVLTLLPSE